MSLEDPVLSAASPAPAGGEKRRRRRGAKARATQAGDQKDSKGGNRSSTQKRKNDEIQPNKIDIGVTSGEEKSKKRRKKKNNKKSIPQPGEEGYLTKTQLRNAAKRKAKKLKKLQSESSGSIGEVDITGSHSSSSKKQKSKRTRSKRGKGENYADPSTRFIDNPKSAPLVNKAKKFFQSLDISFDIHLGAISGWRTVSKLPARSSDKSTSHGNDEGKTKSKCIIGLFRPGSHNIVAVPKCIAHHPSINNAITILQNECDKMGIVPYDETEGKGDLRYVCINVERCTGKVQLTLVWNSSPEENMSGKKSLLEKFTKHLISKSNSIKMHSLWVHFNGQWKHASNIFDYGSSSDGGLLWKHIDGPKYIMESLNLGETYAMKDEKVSLHFPPNVFRQANLDAFTNIIIAIRKYLIEYNASRDQDGLLPTCLELYGGVGTIGLNMIDLVSTFTSSDENPYNKECFEKSVNLLSSAKNRKKCRYIPKNATDVIRDEHVLSNSDCEIVIVDPPRKGLDDYVVQSFIDSAGTDTGSGPQLLVYVSCGFDAFVRDCDKLLKSNRWRLAQGEGHLLFPGSDAIETLAFFHRV